MIILTCATNYTIEDVKPFMSSLVDSGHKGDIYCICNGSPAESYLRELGVNIIQDIDNGFDINSRRFFLWKEILRGYDGVSVITDIRDVVFQLPIDLLPTDGVHVFCEDSAKTIGTCPYNSWWMQQIFGEVRYADNPIICAGFTVGHLAEYCTVMWESLRDLPSIRGLDQAIHNHLVYNGRVDAHIHTNGFPVYTVGYVPFNTVPCNHGIITHNGTIPVVVHQYDRHPNLKEKLKWL